MDFKQFFAKFLSRKALFSGLILVSFGAGFGLAFLQNNSRAGFINNSTPKANIDQYSNGNSNGSEDSCLIKGKPTKTGKKIYYYPGSLFYSKVKTPVCFKSESDAVAAGYKKSAH